MYVLPPYGKMFPLANRKGRKKKKKRHDAEKEFTQMVMLLGR